MATNWKQIKQEQEQRIVDALRQTFDLAEDEVVQATITDSGCIARIGRNPMSMFEFEWTQTNPVEVVCRATSGKLQSNPLSLTLTPAVISLSALNAARDIFMRELWEAPAEENGVVDVGLKEANND